jgi:(2Fe-2S) ferredoxin
MSKYHKTEVTEFSLEGQLVEFVIKDGYKLKGLLLATAEGECYVKLAKHLRAAFDLRLPPGTWLQVVGEKKHDIKTGEVKLKAERVMASRYQADAPSIQKTKTKPAKATILVCQKSDCMKRGGTEVCQALAATLSNRGLDSQVTVRATGCMKNCKAGPNLVMPDKTRYSRVSAAQVPALIDKHLINTPDNLEEEMSIAS